MRSIVNGRRVAGWLLAVLLLVVAHPVQAGRGSGELSLDRAAVAALLGAALPEPLRLDALGGLTLQIEPPATVRFVDGGVEATLRLVVSELRLRARIDVRWEPRVEPLDGVVRLEAVSAKSDPPLPFQVDLAAWLPPARLPRRLDGALDVGRAGELELTCFVEGVVIDDERLHVRLGFATREPGRR